MKNKKMLLVGAVVIILAIASFSFLGRENNSQTNKESFQETKESENTSKNKGNLFESIKDAMAKSLSLKCEYNSPAGKVIAYIKGKNIAMDGFWQGNSNSGVIIKGDKMWVWDKNKKEGFIFTNTAEKNKGNTTPEDVIEDLEKEKQFCQPAVVADSVFEPPSDITFQDIGQLMQAIPSLTQ